MATKRILSHLNSWCFHECISNFHNIHHTQLYKKEEYRHLHGAVREYVNNLKEKPQVSMSHLDQLSMTLCSFWIGARLNHYQYHLIWEPGCHRTSFISNSQRSSQYHGLFFIKFSKIQWNFHQTSKILNSLIWYFDFWKLMDEGNLLNLKILNPILSKILKLIVEAFQNYFYKIKISKFKWK
jgi:hypothetical protein